MKKAYVFPGQGAQFTGMGKSLYDTFDKAKAYFTTAESVLGFDIAQVMFYGDAEALKQTQVTQPAVFIHSVVSYLCNATERPDMVAGHSLGELSALVCNEVLRFEDGLKLVYLRAQAMQKACEQQASGMAAVLGLDDATIEQICHNIKDDVVVPANYNSTGQLVISGTLTGLDKAIEQLKIAGAKKCIKLPVHGAFHSPLMLPAQEELATAIRATQFYQPLCPIYQNTIAQPVSNPQDIQENLIQQLTGPVKWTQLIKAMIDDGATQFIEFGPGKVLQGLIQKIDAQVSCQGFQ